MDKVVYIKPQKCILIDDKNVKISDVADVQSSDADFTNKVKDMILYSFKDEKPDRYVMSVMDIISFIQKQSPDVMVVNLGESDFILEYNMNRKQNIWLEIFKVILIGMIVFFGAAFAIMSFHEDVDITGLFEDVYLLIMGKEKQGVSTIEITYSIGLFFGILIFYNRIGLGRKTNDPTPLEMEMKNYEETINDTLIMADDRGGTDN
ncbi:MAG: stage V sporulation protein AA [Lachnospiraceae bacterium]|nr:stage V sporulation protein AA [Lachnospiraceae bacterium]